MSGPCIVLSMLLSIYLNTSLGCITVLGVYLGDSPSANSLWVECRGANSSGTLRGSLSCLCMWTERGSGHLLSGHLAEGHWGQVPEYSQGCLCVCACCNSLCVYAHVGVYTCTF